MRPHAALKHIEDVQAQVSKQPAPQTEQPRWIESIVRTALQQQPTGRNLIPSKEIEFGLWD